MTRAAAVALAATLLAATSAVLAPDPVAAAPAAKRFKSCTELNKRYPHGVGRPRARDRSSGTPVTTFKRSKKLYRANKHLDRDKDGVACEKR